VSSPASRMQTDPRRTRPSFVIVGTALLGTALGLSNSSIETGLFGQEAGSLEWGPALFRVLLAFHGVILAAAGLLPSPLPANHSTAPVSASAWKGLAALSVLAAALRLYQLNTGLWLDEIITLVNFVRLPVQDILSRFPDQNQHMLYSLLARLCVSVFGEHAWALRLPSVLFGVASIWALSLLARRLVGERQALLACGLMIVSYHHVWFSQNARGYMGLLLFATLATYFWIEAMERDRWRLWIAYAVSLFLGMWLHLTMAFVIAAHGLVYLGIVVARWRRKESTSPRFLAAVVLAGTFTLQALAVSLPEFFRSALHESSMNSEWTKPTWVVSEIVRSLRIGFSGTAALLCGTALVVVGWWSLLRKNSAAAMAMVLPALLGGGTIFALSHNIWPRFFFFCMGFVMIIVIHGAIETPKLLLGSRPLARSIGSALAALFLVASSLTLPRGYAYPKQDYAGARDYVEQHREPGSRKVAAGLAALVYKQYVAPDWDVVSSAQELDRLRREDPDLSLVYTLPFQLAAFDPALWQMIEQDFEVVKTFPGTLGGGEVFVGRLRSRLSQAPAVGTSISE
jgi:mannosyltransferase